jgi:serine/threonine protein kinase
VRPRFGRWKAVKPLGRGGNGVVWQATDPDTAEVAAVKTLKPQAQQSSERRARFEDEIAFLLATPDVPGSCRSSTTSKTMTRSAGMRCGSCAPCVRR